MNKYFFNVLITFFVAPCVYGQQFYNQKVIPFLKENIINFNENKFERDTIKMIGLEVATSRMLNSYNGVYFYEKYEFLEGSFVLPSIVLNDENTTYQLINFVDLGTNLTDEKSLKTIVVYNELKIPILKFTFIDGECEIVEKFTLSDNDKKPTMYGKIIKLNKPLKIKKLRFHDLQNYDGRSLKLYTKNSIFEFIEGLR